MFCKNCSNQLPDNAAFCSKCGTKVTKGETVGQEKAPDLGRRKRTGIAGKEKLIIGAVVYSRKEIPLGFMGL